MVLSPQLLKPGKTARYCICPFLAKTERSGTMPAVRRLDRRQTLFLVRFALFLLVFFVIIWLGPVDRNVIAPFTRGLARVSAVVLNVLGERVSVFGSVIQGKSFAVDIKGGCNGVEAMLLLCAAIAAFEAPWRARLLGLLAGSAALMAFNIVRIVSLYMIGERWRQLFETFHLAVWQTIMFAVAASIFALWSGRFASRHVAART
jgi:exosortase H (IPTLxxWG-CTERM-specific)